jgi:hypothetical protein
MIGGIIAGLAAFPESASQQEDDSKKFIPTRWKASVMDMRGGRPGLEVQLVAAADTEQGKMGKLTEPTHHPGDQEPGTFLDWFGSVAQQSWEWQDIVDNGLTPKIGNCRKTGFRVEPSR